MRDRTTKFWEKDTQVRSTERIRDLAEVFTGQVQLQEMLDLVEPQASHITSRFLEPSCGNGNFLVAILKRKLARIASSHRDQIEYEFMCIMAVGSIYGIDIDAKNIKEARLRMKETLVEDYSLRLNTRIRSAAFDPVIESILKTNIIRGDFINGMQRINLVEYSSPKPHWISRKTYRLIDLITYDSSSLWTCSAPIQSELPLVHFLEMQRNA